MENSFLRCEHISRDDWDSLQSFTSAHSDGGFLADYIKENAFLDEEEGFARTYIVRDRESNDVVAYFSLKSGFVAINEEEGEEQTEFDSIPGVELSNFAVNGAYLTAHPTYKGLGKIVFFDFILPTISEAAKIIGIRFLYIFALPNKSLIANYEKYGFSRLPLEDEKKMHSRIKPRYDEGCIFMYQSL